MEYLFGIVILLGALIFFHELGHFLVAKYYGVKVEVFSFGFGAKLIKKKIGETEYCISLIPLGGYVKLYGEDPTAVISGGDARRSFSNQTVWRRIAIAAAGPVFNILFAVLIYFVIEIGGLKTIIVPYVAYVEKGSAAWEAGLRPEDTLVQVNRRKIIGWERDFLTEIGQHPGKPVQLKYLRKGDLLSAVLIPQAKEEWNLFCERTQVGVLEDLAVSAASAVVGISDPDAFAAKAGFQTGDTIIALNGVQIRYWYELREYLQHIAQKNIVFNVRREKIVRYVRMTLPSEFFHLSESQKERFLGLYSYEFFVRKPFEKNTAGFKAGLKVGDRFVSINDEGFKSWDHFRDKVQSLGKEPGYFRLTYERAGEFHTVQLHPLRVASSHPCEQGKYDYQIGIIIDVSDIYPPLKLEKYQQLNPVKAFYAAASTSFTMMALIMKSIWKMVQGKVSLKSMGGPIMIGKVAGDHLKQGLLPFLVLMAVISINLAILNLLPIPVLDGGHLFFFFYEAIFRRRVSPRVLELAHRAGLVILLALVFLAFYNDISRYWAGIVGFAKKIVGIV